MKNLNDHQKNLLCTGIMWFLILLGIGGCSALGGGFHIKFSEPKKEERP